MIKLVDNFKVYTNLPLDARTLYDTITDMYNAQMSPLVNQLYEGIIAYNKEDDNLYQYKSTNDIDPITGRWKLYSSGALEEDVTSTIEVGGISAKEKVEKGTSFTEFVKELLVKEVKPEVELSLTYDDKPMPWIWNRGNPITGYFYFSVRIKNKDNITGVITRAELYNGNSLIATVTPNDPTVNQSDYTYTGAYGGGKVINLSNGVNEFKYKVYYKSSIDNNEYIIETDTQQVIYGSLVEKIQIHVGLCDIDASEITTPPTLISDISGHFINMRTISPIEKNTDGYYYETKITSDNKAVVIWGTDYWNGLNYIYDKHGLEYLKSFKKYDVSIDGVSWGWVYILPYKIGLDDFYFKMGYKF